MSRDSRLIEKKEVRRRKKWLENLPRISDGVGEEGRVAFKDTMI